MKSLNRVTIEIQGHVLLIGLNRPDKMNAFDSLFLSELAESYTKLEEEPNLRCGVLFAHGDNFTAGLDLMDVAPQIMKGKNLIPDGMIDPWGIYSDRLRTKPLVVAVHGKCLTLGIELALAGDIIVAAKNTSFAQIEIKRGLFPFGGATIRMPQRVGWGNAMRYLLSGDTFDAETAFRIGMVQELTEPGKELSKAVEIANTISKQAPLGVRETLISSRMAAAQSLPKNTRDYFMSTIMQLMKSEDAQEGLSSFLEKREANFTGR